MPTILVACSPGGHLSEARSLMANWEDETVYAVHYLRKVPADLEGKVIHVPHAGRDLRLLRQFCYAFRVIRRVRPKVVISTGANIGVTFGLAAKALGVRFVFIESPTRVRTPSLAGRIAYLFADRFYVRWPELQVHFPKAICFTP